MTLIKLINSTYEAMNVSWLTFLLYFILTLIFIYNLVLVLAAAFKVKLPEEAFRNIFVREYKYVIRKWTNKTIRNILISRFVVALVAFVLMRCTGSIGIDDKIKNREKEIVNIVEEYGGREKAISDINEILTDLEFKGTRDEVRLANNAKDIIISSYSSSYEKNKDK